MGKLTDVRVISTALYFLPVQTRVPLKFGPETLTSVTCARARVRAADRRGRVAEGWGETPLSVQWAWPSGLSCQLRLETLKRCCVRLAEAWAGFDACGHPMELGNDFQAQVLPGLLASVNSAAGAGGPQPCRPTKPLRHVRICGAVGRAVLRAPQSTAPTKAGAQRSARPTKSVSIRDSDEAPRVHAEPPPEPMPRLAALVCSSVFDQALHDAYGNLLARPVYETYGPEFMSRDLAGFLRPAEGATVSFQGRYPADFLLAKPATRLRAWHLVGGLDPLAESDLTGSEPNDGYPVLLADWIKQDGLRCLKVKLRGNDAAWDFERLVRVGAIGLAEGAEWLSADFNCTVTDPDYVNAILDRLRDEHPRLYGMLLYVEQPFPYDLEQHRIDVRSVSARKPLFLDESAHDWRLVQLGRELGWSGVALKTCKTQTGALLSACWAKAHGMALMVQDLTNPMLAQIPHVLLAARVGTIMGVETNAMQFYPQASLPEAAVHPGVYRRRNGMLDLSTLGGPGFGYRLAEIRRELPPPAVEAGR
jgi:L-alanine-DL-glutamate epimerase-like enolase superfamily enzyme